MSSCIWVGDFCELYEPVYFTADVAAVIVEQDREAAVTVDINNRMYEQCPALLVPEF